MDYYLDLYEERRKWREALSLLNRIMDHLDRADRLALMPLWIKVNDELNGVINAIYQKD